MSKSNLNTLENIFHITIKDQCLDVVVDSEMIGFTGTQTNPYEWEMYQTQEVLFSQIYISVPGCPISYKIVSDQYESNAETAIYTISSHESQMKLSGVWTVGVQSTRLYYVNAHISNQQATKVVTNTKAQYWVKINNPCLRSSQITSQLIVDLDYWIKDPSLDVIFSDFSDYASTAYPSYGTNLCGPKSYTIYAEDKVTQYNPVNYPAVTEFLKFARSVDKNKLTVESSNFALERNVFKTFFVRVILVDYYASHPEYAIHWEAFRVRLKACYVTSFSPVTIPDVEYNIYTPV